MLSSPDKRQLILGEVNRIADSEESNDVPIRRAKLGRVGTKTTEGYNRMINWLNLKYPSAEAAKKVPYKNAPAKKKAAKKRKTDPATKSEAPKKKSAKNIAVPRPAAKPDPEKEKAKKAKLDDAIASAKSSSDGKVGANELKAALDAGYSKFFVLDKAKEEMK